MNEEHYEHIVESMKFSIEWYTVCGGKKLHSGRIFIPLNHKAQNVIWIQFPDYLVLDAEETDDCTILHVGYDVNSPFRIRTMDKELVIEDMRKCISLICEGVKK